MMAESYDEVYAAVRDGSGDRAFYRGLAEASGGPVLELGCGTGRILLEVAASGLRITGVEPSPAMRAVLLRKGLPARAQVVDGHMETLDLAERGFRLAIVPFRAFMHLLTVEDQLAALRRIHAHLAPGGQLALDVFDPNPARMALPSEPESPDGTPFTYGGRALWRRFSVPNRDRTTQVQRVRFRYVDGAGAEVGVEDVSMRWLWRYELEHLLARVGFTPEIWSSGYKGEPYVAGSGDIVVVARR